VDVRSPLPQIFLKNWVMLAQVLIFFGSSSEGRSAVFVVAKHRTMRVSGGGEASDPKSGYLTIIPAGADLKLPQQDIKVN
jgi:hypothetical protein